MPLIGGNFLEVRDSVFIKGLPSDVGIDVSDVRKYFENKVGKCCVQMTALSKDKRWTFLTIKFDSNALAEDAIDRFNGKYLWGHKLQVSFWRVPKRLAQSGKFQRNNHNLNNRRWEDKRSFEEESEKSSRHNNDFSRETNTKPTVSRESAVCDGEEEFRVDRANRRNHEGIFAERRKNFNYKEHFEDYSQQYWNSDEGEEEEEAHPIFDENWTEWGSEFSGRNENHYKREYYDRKEELSHADEGDIWPEREEDHERGQDFGQYDNYPEIYQDNWKEECEDSDYAYSERPFEDTREEPPYRGEDLMPRNRQCFENRKYTNTQDCRSQEDDHNSFPSFDKESQWPRWEAVTPSGPTRREPSDSDLIKDTPKDSPWVLNPRSRDKLREFTRTEFTAALSNERPRSDERVRNNHRHFRSRGRHSASPVNVHPKAYGQRGPPLLDKTLKASPETTFSSAHSRSPSSISPARNRHSSAHRESSRSLSAERSSDFKYQETSPGSERSSQAFNKQRLERRKRESRSYSPNSNAKVPSLRETRIENGNENSCRRGTDLRRSLMLHQRRIHSVVRERSREKSIKHSERATKTSPDKRNKSPGSYSSAESSSSTQGTNRKRHITYSDGKRHDDVETNKRRRKTSLNNSDNALAYSVAENRDSTRRKILKTTSESRKQPSLDKKRKTGQRSQHVIDHSIKKRADRLLNDVAVTLTECKIPLRRPGSKDEGKWGSITSVALKGAENVRSHTMKTTAQSKESPPSEKSRLEHATPVATENSQSSDTFEAVSCTNETTVKPWRTVGGALEGDNTTPDYNANYLAVPCFEDSSDQDMSEVEEDCSSIDLSKENIDYAEKNAWSEDVSTENRDFVDVKKDCTYIAEDAETTDRVEVPETVFQSTSIADFMAKMEEGNSLQETCREDAPKTTNDSAKKPVHNSHYFALYQSPVAENKICKENNARNEIMSTNLQQENTPNVDLAQETWLPGDLSDCEECKNQLGASNSSIIEVGRERDGCACQKHAQTSVRQSSLNGQELDDTVSPDETSPGVLLSNKMLCYPVELNKTDKTENAMVGRGEEDHIVELASPDVTKAEHITSELGKDALSVSPTRPEVVPSLEIDVCSIEHNEEALEQEGYNTEDSNCNNSEILTACVMEKVQVDANCKEKEQYVSESDFRIHSHVVNNFDKEVCKVECCEVTPQCIDSDNEDMTGVISSVEEARELQDNVNYLKCQEVTCADEEVYILEGAKVTQREVCDITDIDHVCNSRSEECQGNEDTQQNTSNKVSVGECMSNSEDTSRKDVLADARYLEHEQGVVETNEVRCREENCDNGWNMQDIKNSFENAGFNAFNTEKVRDMEINEVTSGVNNVKEETRISTNVNFINEERKHDDTEHEVFKMVGGCVTQQEVYCSNDGNRSDNTRKENHTEANGGVNMTGKDQESYHVDMNLNNMADAQVTQETRSITNNKTEDLRLKFSSRDVQLSESTSKDKPADIGAHHTCWTGLEPCSSSAAKAHYPTTTNIDAIKSSAFSCSNSNSSLQGKENLHLMTEDFEHVDMEMSSDEDHRDHFIGSSVRGNISACSKEKDGCKPYSPSSPTRRSDEHRSPLTKDDTSPYSPSHPTNVSEGDVEVCITSEGVSCQSGECKAVAPICDAIELFVPEVCKNISGSRGADEEEEDLHFNQTFKVDTIGDSTPRSLRFPTSPKSGAALFQRVSLAKDLIDENLPTKDLMKNRIITTTSENGKSVVKDSENCSDNYKTESSKDSVKPLLRGQKRTNSLPASVSMDAKPKVVYVTAAKTYNFYTDIGTQHKPRILYATNDKSAKPSRSLSLDTALGKTWPLVENSDCNQQPTFVVETISTVEVEKRKDGKDTDCRMEPVLPDGSFICDVPVKRMKFVAEDDDQAAVKMNRTPENARSEGGPDNFTDSGVTSSAFSVGREPLPHSCKANQDSFLSGSIPERDGSLEMRQNDVRNEHCLSTASLEMRQNDVRNEHCLSTDQTPSLTTGSETSWERSNGINICGGSGDTPGTSFGTDKRPLASIDENRDFGFSDPGTSMAKSSVQPGSTVLDVEGENKNGIQSECLREIQQQVLPLGNVQTLSRSTTCSTNKRTHSDSTREASRPYKVPCEPLKLIIPSAPLLNHDIKRTSQPAPHGRYFKKTSSSTDTHASVNVIPESNSFKVLPGDVSAISEFSGDKDPVMTGKDTYSENMELASSLSPAVNGAPVITDCPPPNCKTGNTSPFTLHSSPCKPCNENDIMEKEANNSSGKESEWIALRMERLRKKKEEIEQVYKKECHTVVNVVKMLVNNDPRLEGLLQNAVRRSLQDMGRRCVQELEKQVRPGS